MAKTISNEKLSDSVAITYYQRRLIEVDCFVGQFVEDYEGDY